MRGFEVGVKTARPFLLPPGYEFSVWPRPLLVCCPSPGYEFSLRGHAHSWSAAQSQGEKRRRLSIKSRTVPMPYLSQGEGEWRELIGRPFAARGGRSEALVERKTAQPSAVARVSVANSRAGDSGRL